MDERSQDVEAQVLGTVLTWPRTWSQMAETLTEEHFSQERHRQLWRFLCRMANGGQSWEDMVPLADALLTEGKMEAVGGGAYLSSLSEMATSEWATDYLLRIMEKHHARRALAKLVDIIKSDIDGDPADLRATIEEQLRGLTKDEVRSWMDGAQIAEVSVKALQNRATEVSEGRSPGWRTGVPTLDRFTGGIRAPQIWILMGRPAMGKTAMLLQTCLRLAMDGQKVGIFSLEMQTEGLGQRCLAQLAGVNAASIRDGRLTREEWGQVEAAAERLASLPLYIDDRPASASLIRARVQAFTARVGKLDVIALDYFTLIQKDPGARYGSTNDELDASAKALQSMGKEIGIAQLWACQLNRGLESRLNKRPLASDLRDCGGLENVADTIVGLFRPAAYDPEDHPDLIELLIRKARHGQCADIEAIWNGAHQTIREESCGGW